MKYLALIVTAFIMLAAVSFADSIVIEIIEFDCSAQPSLFSEYSKSLNKHDPANQLSVYEKLKSSELPKKILLQYRQVLPDNHQITQTTELNGAEFELETRDADQSGLMNLKLGYSTQLGDTELRNSKQTEMVMVYGDTLIIPSIESTGQTANDEVIETRTITMTRIEIEITG